MNLVRQGLVNKPETGTNCCTILVNYFEFPEAKFYELLNMKKLVELYRKYKEYVRVDLVMYAVMILLIILYFIYGILMD